MRLDRTLRGREELNWLPPSFKVIRWSVAGTLWAGMVGLLGATLAFAKPGFFVFGKGIAVLFAGGFYAGDRAAKAVLRGRLAKLAHGKLDLRNLQREADGELVHVRGRVKARQPIASVLGAGTVVYRRVAFSVGIERWVHEAAEDFYLVDGSGEMALVEVDGARLIVADGKRTRLEGEKAREVFELTLDPEIRNRSDLTIRVGRADKGQITATERTLAEGDEVEIVGYKSRTVDQSIESRLERDTPMRATLRSGKDLPLLISPV